MGKYDITEELAPKHKDCYTTNKGLKSPLQQTSDDIRQRHAAQFYEEVHEEKDVEVKFNIKPPKVRSISGKKKMEFTDVQKEIIRYFIEDGYVFCCYRGFLASSDYPHNYGYTRVLFNRLKKKKLLAASYDKAEQIYTYTFNSIIITYIN